MKFNEDYTVSTPIENLTVGECIPGQVYEAVFPGETSRDYPAAEHLRICTLGPDDEIILFQLSTGRYSACNDSLNELSLPVGRIYVHRTDIVLSYKENSL